MFIVYSPRKLSKEDSGPGADPGFQARGFKVTEGGSICEFDLVICSLFSRFLKFSMKMK